MTTRLLPMLAIICILSSCAIRTIQTQKNEIIQRPNVLTVFMDGTWDKVQDSAQRNTHVKTLHNLVLKGINSYYIEGVGTDRRFMGGLFGAGTKKRVVKAYLFLANHYSTADSIFLFGFSRGANQCRILSNLIFTVGMMDLRNIQDPGVQKKIVRRCYSEYRTKLRSKGVGVSERRHRAMKFLNKWNSRHSNQQVIFDIKGNIRIELMGLFETVEAFDITNRNEIISPRGDHLNQVVNSNKILHAVALDDNRAWTYTPILLSTSDLIIDPRTDADSVVQEVWFSGSHKDVGGGHKIGPYLQNISLKWMHAELRKYNLFRDTTLAESSNAPPHNMNERFQKILFADNNRSIDFYYSQQRSTYNNYKLKIHRSVIDRMAMGIVPAFKNKKGRKDWFELPPFDSCFERKDSALILKPDCTCIEVVNNK